MTQAVTLAQLGGADSPFFRNRLINGDMRIDQRNAGASITVGGLSYPVDRMASAAGGTGFTAQRVAGTGAYSYDVLLTGAGGNSSSFLFQRIESYNCQDLVNKTITFQVQLSSSIVTSVSVGLFYASAVDNFSAPAAISSTTLTITSTPTIYTWTTNAGANAANGLQIQLAFGAFTSGTIRASGMQVEVGSTATPFERRPYGTELQLCQRYYHCLGGDTPYQSINTVVWYGTGDAVGFFRHPVEMRIPPAQAKTGSWVTLGGGGSAGQTISGDQIGTKTSQLGFTGGSGGTSGQAATLRGNNDSTLRVTFSAEL
jgi:hypothetical protein